MRSTYVFMAIERYLNPFQVNQLEKLGYNTNKLRAKVCLLAGSGEPAIVDEQENFICWSGKELDFDE